MLSKALSWTAKSVGFHSSLSVAIGEKSRLSDSSAAVFPDPLFPTNPMIPGFMEIVTGSSPKQRKFRRVRLSICMDHTVLGNRNSTKMFCADHKSNSELHSEKICGYGCIMPLPRDTKSRLHQ